MNVTNDMINDPKNHAPDNYYKYGKYAGIMNALMDKSVNEQSSTPGGDATLPNPLGMPSSSDADLVALMQQAIMGQAESKGGKLNLNSLLSSFSG